MHSELDSAVQNIEPIAANCDVFVETLHKAELGQISYFSN